MRQSAVTSSRSGSDASRLHCFCVTCLCVACSERDSRPGSVVFPHGLDARPEGPCSVIALQKNMTTDWLLYILYTPTIPEPSSLEQTPRSNATHCDPVESPSWLHHARPINVVCARGTLVRPLRVVRIQIPIQTAIAPLHESPRNPQGKLSQPVCLLLGGVSLIVLCPSKRPLPHKSSSCLATVEFLQFLHVAPIHIHCLLHVVRRFPNSVDVRVPHDLAEFTLGEAVGGPLVHVDGPLEHDDGNVCGEMRTRLQDCSLVVAVEQAMDVIPC